MVTGTPAHPITRPAPENGADLGVAISGVQNRTAAEGGGNRGPLVIALHGGTYSSAYFDIPGHSLLERADEQGIPVIALDRPAYGASTMLEPSDSIIASNALVVSDVIGRIWEEWSDRASGIVIIAHSIGGAIATDIAANRPSWPLLGIAVSGCLLDVPPESAKAWQELPDIPLIDLPTQVKDSVMFGPEGSYDSEMPAASHPSNTPVPRAELIDITSTWIERVREVASRVAVPVHSRQAEFDALWITDAQQVAYFAAAFVNSPRVDAALVPGSGHCIDFHIAGAGFQAEQLAFVKSLA